MKRLYALALGVFLSLSLIAAGNAAPTGASGKPRQQGIRNAKKAMKGKLERDKKVQEAGKQGQAHKKQAQSGR